MVSKINVFSDINNFVSSNNKYLISVIDQFTSGPANNHRKPQSKPSHETFSCDNAAAIRGNEDLLQAQLRVERVDRVRRYMLKGVR